MVYAEHQFSLWGLKFEYMKNRECLYDQPPIKTLDTESLMSLSIWLAAFHTRGQNCQNCPYDSISQVKDPWKFHPVPPDIPHVSFPFTHFTLYPFAVINYTVSTTIC